MDRDRFDRLERDIADVRETIWRLQGRVNALETIAMQEIFDRAQMQPEPHSWLASYVDVMRKMIKSLVVDPSSDAHGDRLRSEVTRAIEDMLEGLILRQQSLPEKSTAAVYRQLDDHSNKMGSANTAFWQLKGRLDAMDQIAYYLLALRLAALPNKEQALSEIERHRVVAKGHPVDQETEQGKRSQQEKVAAMEDFLSHVAEVLLQLRPDWR